MFVWYVMSAETLEKVKTITESSSFISKDESNKVSTRILGYSIVLLSVLLAMNRAPMAKHKGRGVFSRGTQANSKGATAFCRRSLQVLHFLHLQIETASSEQFVC